MRQITENLTLLENRENMYRLLGRIYQKEIDLELFNKLATLNFAANCQESMLNEGYRLFESFFQQRHLDVITDLAVDYARVFLGAGVQEDVVALPYESVYTSPERLIMQEARDEMVKLYREYNVDINQDLIMPEDQIGLQLEFMGHLISKSLADMKTEKYDDTQQILAVQSEFLQKHLLNWSSEFCEDILKCSGTDFYKAIAKITQGFLELDKEIIEYLDTTVMISAHKEEAHKVYMARQDSCEY